jgi:hypothetical protein
VRHFEGRYCVADEVLPASYLAARQEWFGTAASFAGAFGLKDEVLHDALLLLDRAVAAGGEQLLALDAGALITSCLLIAARQGAHTPADVCACVCACLCVSDCVSLCQRGWRCAHDHTDCRSLASGVSLFPAEFWQQTQQLCSLALPPLPHPSCCRSWRAS